MKARGTYYIPTLMAAEGGKEILAKGGYPPTVAAKMTAAVESLNQVVRKAIAKGVRIGMGTDAAVYPHGRNVEEFHLLAALGMSPVDALRAGTSVNAELLGMQTRIGTLEVKIRRRHRHARRPDAKYSSDRKSVFRDEGRCHLS